MFAITDGVSSLNDVLLQFGKYNWKTKKTTAPECAVPEGTRLVFHEYTDENYSGNALTLLYNDTDKEWYLNTASHCSCYGLEGQWGPSNVSEERILEIVKDDYYGLYCNSLILGAVVGSVLDPDNSEWKVAVEKLTAQFGGATFNANGGSWRIIEGDALYYQEVQEDE